MNILEPMAEERYAYRDDTATETAECRGHAVVSKISAAPSPHPIPDSSMRNYLVYRRCMWE